jgi:hypothetical protein
MRRKTPSREDAEDIVSQVFIAASEQVSLQRAEYAHLHIHLAKLPPMQQETLRCAAIAAALGKGEGTIRVILSRTRTGLRSLYHQDQKEEHQCHARTNVSHQISR